MKAVVLVGGGGCGRVQVPALKQFYQAGLLDDLQILVGTSVGGLNACALAVGLAQGKGCDVLENAWARVQKNSDIYTPDLLNDMQHPWMHPFDEAVETHNFIFGPGALNTDPLVGLVKDVLGNWNTDMIKEKTGITLRVRAMHYERNRAETLEGDLGPMALATSAIEGLFPSRFGYGDGGAVDNEPIGEALALGATKILVIFCGPEDPASNSGQGSVKVTWDTPSKQDSGLKNALRTLQGITQRGEALADEEANRAEKAGVQVVWCYPAEDTGNALDFSPRDLWKKGFLMADKAIADVKEKCW